MPNTKDLLQLFRAIGTRDITRAINLSRKVAAEYGAKGQYRAEKDLISALDGTNGHRADGSFAPVGLSFSQAPSYLMPLVAKRTLGDLELPPNMVRDFEDILKEWEGRDKLAKHSISRRWRLLFHGPPGCGKSASAAALATAANLPGYLVRFDSLIGAYLGQTALKLRELFNFAESNPCVLLFDEVDALARKRGNPMDVGELDRIVIAFMQELEHARGQGFIVATSNLPNMLDSALWRRFDLRLTFPKPTAKQLERFAIRRAKNFGLTLSNSTLSRVRKCPSWDEAEQVILAEARRELLSKV